MTGGGAGGPLAAESLANVLAVQLIRHVLAPRRPGHGPDGALRAVASHRHRVHRGTPRRQPDLGADGGGRPFEPVPLRPAVQGGLGCRRTWSTSSLLRIERAKQFLQGGGDLSLGGGRRTSRLRGPEPVLPSLQVHSSASRQGSSECPQESPNRPQALTRNGRATSLPFS